MFFTHINMQNFMQKTTRVLLGVSVAGLISLCATPLVFAAEEINVPITTSSTGPSKELIQKAEEQARRLAEEHARLMANSAVFPTETKQSTVDESGAGSFGQTPLDVFMTVQFALNILFIALFLLIWRRFRHTT